MDITISNGDEGVTSRTIEHKDYLCTTLHEPDLQKIDTLLKGLKMSFNEKFMYPLDLLDIHTIYFDDSLDTKHMLLIRFTFLTTSKITSKEVTEFLNIAETSIIRPQLDSLIGSVGEGFDITPYK